ncbi:hypothetical protein [Cellulomonas sp. ATA003]|uniref:hypothetical protein n=1 Tax=Cellulomonas sp. ATA003 TaxID=3073064 RepID=UPI0028737DC6|nr:hypothetical protein [Cellulomonas sp. ATA003]WNB84335.1 hypothetical protein REH70_10610 [Cellulomonas sp. ATA003]
MSSKADRKTAREAVATYHEAQLAALVERVGAAVDGFRDGQLDALEVDQVLLQYSRAAKELWKFCNAGDVESVATAVREQLPLDWWERGAPRARR